MRPIITVNVRGGGPITLILSGVGREKATAEWARDGRDLPIS